MESTTYIVDAPTLIEKIHDIKQWVYQGSASLLIPRAALDQIDKDAETSLIPKETPKEPASKRTSGRAARRSEHPLFDLNPRTAKEFLKRAQEKGIENVMFQMPGEEFSQWKEEEQKAAVKVESPTAPPSSFAEALLRKLNFKDGSDDANGKGPSKPRLVARSNEPKSPWSYHKVPKISAAEAPKNSKELLSCALWRLHEYGNNPIAPETFALLTNKPEVKAAAEKLNVPTTTTTSVRGKLADIAMKDDRRETEGLVHIEFPVPSTGNSVAHDGNKDQEATDDSDNLVINGDKILSAEDVLDDEELEELNEALAANVSTTKPEIASILSTVDHAILDAPTHPEEESKPLSLNGISPQQQSNEATLNDEGAQQDDVKKQDKLAEATTARAISKSPNRSATPSSRIEAEAMANGAPDDESELDSDEEIIVFNPKARLASAAAKRSDTQRSRPSTANGSVSLKPTEPRSQVSVPVTGEQPSPPGSSTLKPKSPVGSALKAQSPVFTPGQLYVPSQSPVAAKASPPVLQQQPNGNRRKSPPRVTQDRPTSTSRQPRAPVLPRPQSQDQNAEVRRQTEIIQRQRQAIQRQAQAAAKPPPRQVRMEPTENPTIIDPDAFDRSYVVQPVSNPPNTSTASKRRSGGGGRRRSPRNSPPNASPKRPVSRAEPDVDFVLKSGAPRGSMRGKGKLWVP